MPQQKDEVGWCLFLSAAERTSGGFIKYCFSHVIFNLRYKALIYLPEILQYKRESWFWNPASNIKLSVVLYKYWLQVIDCGQHTSGWTDNSTKIPWILLFDRSLVLYRGCDKMIRGAVLFCQWKRICSTSRLLFLQ